LAGAAGFAAKVGINTLIYNDKFMIWINTDHATDMADGYEAEPETLARDAVEKPE
jgi:hypothetical protein